MEQQRAPQPGFQNFTKTIPGHIVGIILAIGFSLLGMYSGLFSQCYGLGFILIACFALYIPKIFGITKVRHLVAVGVAFFLILTAFGTFVVSKPMLENNSVPYNSESFFEVDTENGKILVPCNETPLDDVKLNFNKVQPFAYLTIKTDNENPHLIQKSDDGRYKSDIKIENGCIYQYSLEKKSDDRIKLYYLNAVDDTELVKFCLLGNAYYCGIIFTINMLMLFFGIRIRKNLENMRAKMEAEGRLYPQGYGHCKECGSIVLPGEICCRRCGAYIEVPDEFRHRKVDMVQCSECEAEIPRDAKTCPKCGVTFDEEEEVVYVDTRETDLVGCPECGMKIPSNAKFCPKCGAILDKKEKM
ncbi:MAG: zinc ribbon domain-containing protein [archaeon]|nr:zinc ribbon domain-containing protein [archaeon]